MKNLSLNQINNVSGAGTCWGVEVRTGEKNICIGIHVE